MPNPWCGPTCSGHWQGALRAHFACFGSGQVGFHLLFFFAHPLYTPSCPSIVVVQGRGGCPPGSGQQIFGDRSCRRPWWIYRRRSLYVQKDTHAFFWSIVAGFAVSRRRHGRDCRRGRAPERGRGQAGMNGVAVFFVGWGRRRVGCSPFPSHFIQPLSIPDDSFPGRDTRHEGETHT